MHKFLKMLIFTPLFILLPLISNIIMISLIKDISFINEMRSQTNTSIFIIIDTVALTLLFFFVKYVRRESNPIKFASFNKTTFSNIGICAAIGFLLTIVTTALLNIDAFKTTMMPIDGSIGWIVGGNLFVLIIAQLINNMYKEICFRGLAFNEMRRVIPVAVALIIQASFYAAQLLYFGNAMAAIVYAFLGQLVFGIIFLVGRSIWSSYTSQMLCTMGLILIRRTPMNNMFNNVNSIILLSLSVVGVVALIIVLNNKSRSEITDKATLPLQVEV